MANFKTHVGVAFSASSFLAVLAVDGGLFDMAESAEYVSLGVAGGLLPDVDSDHSRPVKKLFTALAICSAGMVGWGLETRLTTQQLTVAVVSVFMLVRYPGLYFFQKMTVHRGVFHSLLAGIFFSLVMVCIEHYLLEASNLKAWLGGVFLLFGFLVHLCLDELFSVDLVNGRMKKSFGTALKIYGYQNIQGSLVLLSLGAGMLLMAPSSIPLCKALRQADWSRVNDLSSQFSQAIKGMLG
ncbi:MAG: metal-dependent hydrolase [Gammaproteobacteria bacterium]